MIIWGWRGREINQGSGQFFCPRCERQRSYQQVRVATYFTLYFIPLFETQHHGDYIQCKSCNEKFVMEVLDYRPSSDAERAFSAVQADLASGTPVQMVRTKLLNAGLEEVVVEKLIHAVVGEKQLQCYSCNLTFMEGVRRCSGCGGDLEATSR